MFLHGRAPADDNDGLMRILYALFAALFLFGAAVQYNDPDPLRWVLIYLAAAIVAILAAMGRAPRVGAAIVGAFASLWAASLSPAVVGRVPFLRMFESWEMKDVRVEESREMYGLLLIATAMAIVAVAGSRGRRSR
jgi:hypothetical protein